MNIIFGRINRFGQKVFAAPDRSGGGGSNEKIKYLPDKVQVIAYNQDGTKTAMFGDRTEEMSFESIDFELVETGCGQAKIKFKRFPTFTEIQYGQRLDIHLFGDSRPWWSGYVLNRPDTGGTQSEYVIECHGFYDALKRKYIFKTYENKEISRIVKDICRQAESLVGITYNSSKIYNTNYVIKKIVFDGVNVQECLKQLSEFAVDWVFGVDEYHEFYFKPRVKTVNEEARFWAGVHLSEYLPTKNVDKLVNWAKIKGAAVDDQGEQWLAVVEDIESQKRYGRREGVWTLPTAYEATDAKRWGSTEIEKYKNPIETAKVKGVILEYPKPDGQFWVRRLSTDGKAVITNLEGEAKTYPITKLKYSISGSKGIQLDMELGEPPFETARWMLNKERDNRNNELLQQASNQQLR